MFRNTVCYTSMPITVQASLRFRKLALHSNRSYCYAFRSRAALTNTSPHVSSEGEMITPRFGLMKYIPVFHPSGVALRSKSVPDGFVTKDFTMMYCRVGIAHWCPIIFHKASLPCSWLSSGSGGPPVNSCKRSYFINKFN